MYQWIRRNEIVVLFHGQNSAYLPVEIMRQLDNNEILVRYVNNSEEEEVAEVEYDELRPPWYRQFISVFSRNVLAWRAADPRMEAEGQQVERAEFILDLSPNGADRSLYRSSRRLNDGRFEAMVEELVRHSEEGVVQATSNSRHILVTNLGFDANMFNFLERPNLFPIDWLEALPPPSPPPFPPPFPPPSPPPSPVVPQRQRWTDLFEAIGARKRDLHSRFLELRDMERRMEGRMRDTRITDYFRPQTPQADLQQIELRRRIVETTSRTPTPSAILEDEDSDSSFDIDPVAGSSKENANTTYSFRCRICHRRFLTKDGLIDHIRSHHKGTNQYLECDLCQRLYGSRLALMRHRRRVHPTDLRSVDEMEVRIGASSVFPYPCKLCQKTFPTRSIKLAHIAKEHDKEKEVAQRKRLRALDSDTDSSSSSDDDDARGAITYPCRVGKCAYVSDSAQTTSKHRRRTHSKEERQLEKETRPKTLRKKRTVKAKQAKAPKNPPKKRKR